MAKRKLGYVQIHRAVQISRRTLTAQRLRPVTLDAVVGRSAPEGCFAAYAGGIILPKRERGDKFVVHYTIAAVKEF